MPGHSASTPRKSSLPTAHVAAYGPRRCLRPTSLPTAHVAAYGPRRRQGQLRLYPQDIDAAEGAEAVVAAHGADAAAAQVRLVVEAPQVVPVWATRRGSGWRSATSSATPCAPHRRVAWSPVWATESDGWAQLVVRDTGIGIAPSTWSASFDRFCRVDASRRRGTGGSGLGLAITKHLVEAHGGSIGLSSAEGQGTTVAVRLPLAADAFPDAVPARAALPGEAAAGG